MTTRVIQFKDNDYDVTLTVRSATVLDGMTRSVLIAQMFAQPFDASKADVTARLRRVLLLHTYPGCIAATSFENQEAKKLLDTTLTPEDFLGLPEALVLEWEKVVFELNPHWITERTSEKETKGEANEPNDKKTSTKN